jgi:hypothetical protein
VRKLSDGSFILPMTGTTSSFNISVSVGITLAYLRTLDMLQPNMQPEEATNLKFKWLLNELRNANSILKQKGIIIDDL